MTTDTTMTPPTNARHRTAVAGPVERGVRAQPLISRVFAMASQDTFDCAPMMGLVQTYLHGVSVDPFARNKRLATYTNDLNPNTMAEYHMDAVDFLKMLNAQGVKADCVILDPPYSPRQITDCYAEAGLKATMRDTQNSRLYAEVKREVERMVKLGGVVLSFGWNTAGMQTKAGWVIEEIKIVCHGAGRNDTLCMAERKTTEQVELAL